MPRPRPRHTNWGLEGSYGTEAFPNHGRFDVVGVASDCAELREHVAPVADAHGGALRSPWAAQRLDLAPRGSPVALGHHWPAARDLHHRRLRHEPRAVFAFVAVVADRRFLYRAGFGRPREPLDRGSQPEPAATCARQHHAG